MRLVWSKTVLVCKTRDGLIETFCRSKAVAMAEARLHVVMACDGDHSFRVPVA